MTALNVIVTGSSVGIGEAIAKYFKEKGHNVIGIDILPASREVIEASGGEYTHYRCDISAKDSLPNIEDVHILVNNAGLQSSGVDIDNNLKGTMNCVQKYALLNPNIVSVLNMSDAVAHMGTSSGEYVASKGGISAYTIWAAKELADYGATCNCLSFGGVMVDSNAEVMNGPEYWEDIMNMTPLRKWATKEEVAEWVYFMTVINKSCSGQDIVIDNLESLNNRYV